MILKEKWKPALVALSAAACSVALLCLPAAVGATPQYPDLRPLPPTDIRLGTQLIGGEHHYVVRFSSYVHNAGQGPLELRGSPHAFLPDGTFDVRQVVYGNGSAPRLLDVGTFYFHRAPGHDHFHFDDFAHFELWSQRGYERAAASGFTTGEPMYKSGKISFCLMDSTRVDAPPSPLGGLGRRYGSTCSPVEQGISVGWADLYYWTLAGQWVDVGPRPLEDGTYVIRTIGDPSNKLYESADKADPARDSQVANSSARYITIEGGRLVDPPPPTF